MSTVPLFPLVTLQVISSLNIQENNHIVGRGSRASGQHIDMDDSIWMRTDEFLKTCYGTVKYLHNCDVNR